jgi:hypothetical protein
MLEPMGLRIEWRSRKEGDDVIIAVDDSSNEVLRAWEADPELLTDFLNDMSELSDAATGKERLPNDNWGNLVIARSSEGDVLEVDPQLYWEGIAYWFRSRGNDPHLWQGRS